MPGWPDFACSTASMASVLIVLIARRAMSSRACAGGMVTGSGDFALGRTRSKGLLEIGGERADDLVVVRLGHLLAHDDVLHVARVGRAGDHPAAFDEAERRGDRLADLEDFRRREAHPLDDLVGQDL